jgi:predicted Zn-ribbon and HTH transcriptional regulator
MPIITKEKVTICYDKNGYDVIKYNGIGAITKHIVRHRSCGYEFPSDYNHFKNGGRRCPNCFGNKTITEEQVLKCYQDNNYEVTKYNGTGNKTKHMVKHNSCGHEFPSNYDKFKNAGRICPNCFGNKTITKEQLTDCYNKNGYDISTYNGVGVDTKHIVKHHSCGYEFPSDYGHFKSRSQRCPNCKSLRSERLCRKIFCEIFSGYNFPKRRPNFLERLELDGYCEDLQIAFEYNGKQHYKLSHVIPYDTQELLEKRQERDRRKLEICSQKGIKLCVIPYTYSCSDSEKLETFIRDWVNLDCLIYFFSRKGCICL